MAETLDVAARLAEGRPAVDNIGDYVWACHLLGYQNQDLTLHAAQVRDWYSSEDGLDLRALDADRAALDAAAAATENARQLQEQQLDALAGAWQGRGGDASHEFLLRHGEASDGAATALRDAVDALAALRDDLWHAVDEKVDAAVSIDDRRQVERPEWQAATQTVTTGAGDRAVASELVDQQVKPFVDNDIRSDWLTAMQSAMAAVAAAFDAATAALTSEPSAMFEVPGDLGPASMPPPSGAPPAEAAGTAPSAWTSPAPAAAPAPGAMTAPTPSLSAAADPAIPTAPAMPAAPMPAPSAIPAAAPSAAPAMPTMPSLGDLGGGLPGAAGGLAGLGTQLADAFGGLLDRRDDAVPDPPELKEEPEDGEPVPHDEILEEVLEDDPAEEVDDLADAEALKAEAEPDDSCVDEIAGEAAPAGPALTPPPAPMPPPQPIVEPAPSPEPVSAGTPCEIAADELPQAGP
jgi:hypothetical protein